MIINDLYNNKKQAIKEMQLEPMASAASRELQRQQGLRPSGPQRLFSELASMLHISGPELQVLVRTIPGFPKVHSRSTSFTHGSKGYYDLAEFKRWVVQNQIREKIAANQGVAEASLGDYRKKAALSKATSQMDRFFGRDDPAAVARADQTIAKRERGLARADARIKPYTAPAHDAEKYQRDLTARYPNIDDLVRKAELNRDPNYEYADGPAYYQGREAEQNYQRLKQIQRVIQGLNESLQRTQP